MSKYHPLDVRHPSNRDRDRNSYLLAPADHSTYALRAVEKPAQAPSRRGADYRKNIPADPVVETPITVPVARAAPHNAVGDPWGSPNSPVLPTTGARRNWLPRLLIFGAIAFVILKNFDLMDDVSRFVTDLLYELGL
ncbi:hypothetical protein [Pararhodobacter sp.]|uniref:hypothetical protein n=1 Tax=Pararhodobacter sp. TaxID=2127056 RepID=UPI002AFF03C2|nr:hypothetical protein [Pararhodobacter sp.]